MPTENTADNTVLLELQPQDVLIILDLVRKAMDRNKDLRIKSAYSGILQRMVQSVEAQD
jgi:hypothetical protein